VVNVTKLAAASSVSWTKRASPGAANGTSARALPVAVRSSAESRVLAPTTAEEMVPRATRGFGRSMWFSLPRPRMLNGACSVRSSESRPDRPCALGERSGGELELATGELVPPGDARLRAVGTVVVADVGAGRERDGRVDQIAADPGVVGERRSTDREVRCVAPAAAAEHADRRVDRTEVRPVGDRRLDDEARRVDGDDRTRGEREPVHAVVAGRRNPAGKGNVMPRPGEAVYSR
jgi:hypothetical protein